VLKEAVEPLKTQKRRAREDAREINFFMNIYSFDKIFARA
jgi:hypothetical protein